MSRHEKKISEHVTVISGSDHALGNFIQVQDSRYAGSPDDYQGEGYVLDYDQALGFSINLLNLKKEDLPFNDEQIIARCNEVCAKYEGLPKIN
jgi:hypothetical protein